MTKQSYKPAEYYVLNAISWDGYDDKERPFIEDKLRFLKQTFYSEYGWHVKQVGQFEALVSWLQGLPSACNIAFYNHEIIKLGIEWGLLPKEPTQRQEWDWCEKWFRLIAMRINNLWLRHNI